MHKSHFGSVNLAQDLSKDDTGPEKEKEQDLDDVRDEVADMLQQSVPMQVRGDFRLD